MKPCILICDDERGMLEMLEILLTRAGYAVVCSQGLEDARARVESGATFDLVVTDLAMPDGSGMDLLELAITRDASAQVIVITAHATTEQAVQAMRLGAYDYVQKPFRNDELLATVEKALEKRQILVENRALKAQVSEEFRLGELIGKAPRMQAVMRLIRRVASTRSSVLITGASGTGKEVVARALHFESDRSQNPFVVVNCGALPESLMESELFGHARGAFTGAAQAKAGLIRSASGGTLFLDEVGELPPALQVKLLRVLQERLVRPVGDEQEIEVDVRIIAATNRNLEEAVASGLVRQDLFYRLNVIRIELPPLSQRIEDVPLLAEHFLAKHSALEGKRLRFSSEASQQLIHQAYPGNVRELENLVERAVAFATEPMVTRSDLSLDTDASQAPLALQPTGVLPPDGLELDDHLASLEKDLLVQALERSGGVRTRAAKLLGMSFRSFRYRLAKYGLADNELGDDAGEVDAPDPRRSH